MARRRDRCRKLAFGLVVVAGVTPGLAGRVAAQWDQTELRADDGTAYQVLRVTALALGPGVERVRVTSVAGSSGGVGGCVVSMSASGQLAAAVAGAIPPLQVLHPYNAVVRTAILAPNDISALTFDPAQGGRLSLGSGGAALNICKDALDCSAAGNVQPLFPLSASTTDANGTVPFACIANGVSAGAPCDAGNIRNTFAFGIAATNMTCNNAGQVTVQSAICAPEPADGIALDPGEALVVIYDSGLIASGFLLASAGFQIDADGSNPPGCAANQIVGATARVQPIVEPPPPTDTPTALAATVTVTATHTPTPLRQSQIPVVPSPTSPAGLAMIAALVGGLLWALRRLRGPTARR